MSVTNGFAAEGGPGFAPPSRRALMLGAGFAATAGAALLMTPRLHEHSLAHARVADLVPQKVGPWSEVPSDAFVMPDDYKADGFYDQVATRAFAAPGLPVMMLLIAYGEAQSGLMKVHRPEVCFASAGFKIEGDHPALIPVGGNLAITGRGFLGRREDRTERVLYWTRISNAFPSDRFSQRLVTVERGLAGVIPDGVLVRISTSGDAKPADTEPAMKTFARTLVASSDPKGRTLLLGALKTSAGA